MLEVLFFSATVLISIYTEATIGVMFNLPGMGCIVGISFVGAAIIFVIRHRK